MGKKFYMESLGCSKNQVDAEVIINLVKEKGYEITFDAKRRHYFYKYLWFYKKC